MDQGQRYKKGEFLFKEGDSLNKVYVVQSGRVHLIIERSGRSVQLEEVGPSQLLGEQGAIGNGKANYSAVAASEVRVLELPANILKDQVEAATGGVKLLVKGLGDEVRRQRSVVKGYVLESDTAPIPQKLTPRVFTLLNLVSRHSGEVFQKNDDSQPQVHTMSAKKEESKWAKDGLVLKWSTVKVFATRMFLESLQRVQGAVEVLTKLGYASMHFVPSEEDEAVEVLDEICIHDVEFVEQFAEFYQYNYFKGGKAEILYVDSMARKVAEAFVKLAEDQEADRRGAVHLEYQKLLQDLKSQFRFDLTSNLLSLLEKKGLFVKRATRDDGVFLSFDKEEFRMISSFWNLISELDQWNEKGFVDMTQPESLSEDGGMKCPDCATEIQVEQKFCMECGCKLVAA
ncbi:MAG: cyclic nucleotide-binding domain-containing protein [Bdellovibrionales bacterium]|nr:cyclic nucleotide-binding domain-containing protein [Bdellovibrionales bacterium]